MSSFNNNQVLHIAAECAVIAAITFYVSIKYKQIQATLESLNNRLEEQSEIIQKHEVMIKQLNLTLNQFINNSGNTYEKRNTQDARRVPQMKSKTSQQIPKIFAKSILKN